VYPTTGPAGSTSEVPDWAAWDSGYAPPPPPRRRLTGRLGDAGGRAWRRPAVRLAAVVSAATLVAGAAGVGIGAALFGGGTGGVQIGSNAPVVASPAVAPASYAAVAAKILPSVVSIQVTTSAEQDTGSGVIIRSDGYILTNNHVVSAAEGIANPDIQVTFNDGSTAPARIVGADQADDLAVIKVNRTGLQPATLGDSASLRVGDPVLAVGSPLGLQGTVTNGIVSAVNRPVQTQDPNSGGLSPFGSPFGPPTGPTVPTVINAIQTDAPINPGNSGGPLVDMAGQVVGINSAIASVSSGVFGSTESGNIGVGFAIPIDQARTIAAELIATGHATHPALGIGVADVTAANGSTEVMVESVQPGGAAAAAGIHRGDVILALDGTPVADSDALIAMVRSHDPGQTVRVTILRSGRKLTLSVKLGDSTAGQG
jgi:putative serine protease PepD